MRTLREMERTGEVRKQVDYVIASECLRFEGANAQWREAGCMGSHRELGFKG